MRAQEFVIEEFDRPSTAVVDAIQKVLPVAQEIWFHGSRATGKHRKNSDTDILVIIPDDLVGDQYLAVVRILQKLSAHFDNYDIQPTKAGTNIHRIAQEEGQLLWSNKQGVAEGEVVPLGKKHRGDLDSVNSCSKCGGKLEGGTYMGQRIKVCQPCKQVYLPPNSGIDQQGNKIKEQGVEENFADGKKPGRKGLAKRSGVDCKQPVSKLRSIAANSSGERQRMAHWCANMKSGRNK